MTKRERIKKLKSFHIELIALLDKYEYSLYLDDPYCPAIIETENEGDNDGWDYLPCTGKMLKNLLRFQKNEPSKIS